MINSTTLQAAAVGQADAAPAASSTVRGDFLFSNDRFHGDPEVLWPGFLKGLRGFENFYEPVGNPIYFETPFNYTGARFLYLNHQFPEDNVLKGGDLNVYALQVRVALTERLALIATKDGYSDLSADGLPQDEGWNDIAGGLKYTFYADKDADLLAAFGIRYQGGNGDSEVLQGGCQEFSPFLAIAKGWDLFHTVGNVTYRIPLDTNKGNSILQWSAHADYEIFKGFAPMIEFHGLHYLDDGNRTPLDIGGLDYTNLGSTEVGGSTVVALGIGARAKFTPNFSLGATYEFPLTNSDADIHDGRVTVDFIVAW
jgi:hypothetical protein